jgi:hypothetical protein
VVEDEVGQKGPAPAPRPGLRSVSASGGPPPPPKLAAKPKAVESVPDASKSESDEIMESDSPPPVKKKRELPPYLRVVK